MTKLRFYDENGDFILSSWMKLDGWTSVQALEVLSGVPLQGSAMAKAGHRAALEFYAHEALLIFETAIKMGRIGELAPPLDWVRLAREKGVGADLAIAAVEAALGGLLNEPGGACTTDLAVAVAPLNPDALLVYDFRESFTAQEIVCLCLGLHPAGGQPAAGSARAADFMVLMEAVAKGSQVGAAECFLTWKFGADPEGLRKGLLYPEWALHRLVVAPSEFGGDHSAEGDVDPGPLDCWQFGRRIVAEWLEPRAFASAYDFHRAGGLVPDPAPPAGRARRAASASNPKQPAAPARRKAPGTLPPANESLNDHRHKRVRQDRIKALESAVKFVRDRASAGDPVKHRIEVARHVAEYLPNGKPAPRDTYTVDQVDRWLKEDGLSLVPAVSG